MKAAENITEKSWFCGGKVIC